MKRVNVYYLIDTSGGMCGHKIGTVNASMEDVLPLYMEIEKLTGASIYFQAMQYDTYAKWINEKAVSLCDYIWRDMQAGGLADFGQSLKLLKFELENLDTDVYPIIIHIAYCSPTDNWEPLIEQLENIDAYNRALRMVINIEGAFDENVAFRFTKDFNNIVQANNTVIKEKITNGIKNFFYNYKNNCLDLSITNSNYFRRLSFVLETYGIKTIRDMFSGNLINMIEDNNISREDYERILLITKELLQCVSVKVEKSAGKIKCEKLRAIRTKIAKENGIKYEPKVCNHEGDCLGTCPACDEEIQYLNEQLRAKKDRNEEIVLKGIAADDIKSVTDNGLVKVVYNEEPEVMGNVEIDVEGIEGSWGIW